MTKSKYIHLNIATLWHCYKIKIYPFEHCDIVTKSKYIHLNIATLLQNQNISIWTLWHCGKIKIYPFEHCDIVTKSKYIHLSIVTLWHCVKIKIYPFEHWTLRHCYKIKIYGLKMVTAVCLISCDGDWLKYFDWFAAEDKISFRTQKIELTSEPERFSWLFIEFTTRIFHWSPNKYF